MEARMQSILEKRRKSGKMRSLSPRSPDTPDFISNDYLGLSRLISPAIENIGSSSTGSRLLSGDSTSAHDLERFLSIHHNAPAALLFNSGYTANLSLFSCIARVEDTFIYDEFVHASVHDGLHLSRCKNILKFTHNCLDDLMLKVGNVKSGMIFVAVESLYSMDGDYAPLKRIVEALKPFKNSYLIVDEAHATGVIGKQGKGLVTQLNLEEHVFARLHTFGKAVGVHGAVILGSTTLKNYLLNYARPLIYSTFLPEHTLLSIRAAYDILIKRGDELQKQLEKNIYRFRSGLSVPSSQILYSTSPIQGIIIPGNANVLNFANKLKSEFGIIILPIRSPTVEDGCERLRVCIHSHNTEEEIDLLCNGINQVYRRAFLEKSEAKIAARI